MFYIYFQIFIQKLYLQFYLQIIFNFNFQQIIQFSLLFNYFLFQINQQQNIEINIDQAKQLYLSYFEKYRSIDTTSYESNAEITPSNKAEFDLAKLIQDDLTKLNIQSQLTDKCYLYSTLQTQNKDQALILVSHIDSSEDAPSKNIKAKIIKYQGEDKIELESGIEITKQELGKHVKISDEILVTDGTTMLQSDDLAGCSIIMTLLTLLTQQNYQQTNYPSIVALFTPDEEIGMSFKNIENDKLQQHFKHVLGFTIDGGNDYEISYETFNAYSFHITVKGFNIHPGDAYKKMDNSCLYATELIQKITQKFRTPENSKDRQNYVLINGIQGHVDETSIKGIIRTFDKEDMQNIKMQLEQIVDQFNQELLSKRNSEETSCNIKITYQYVNMVEYISQEFIVLVGELQNKYNIKFTPIRGGVDASEISKNGIQMMNLFTGTGNMHSIKEFNIINQAMDSIQFLLDFIKMF